MPGATGVTSVTTAKTCTKIARTSAKIAGTSVRTRATTAVESVAASVVLATRDHRARPRHGDSSWIEQREWRDRRGNVETHPDDPGGTVRIPEGRRPL